MVKYQHLIPGGTQMEDFFDPDSWLMSALSALADLIIVNILWLLTSIPIVTLGASTAALYSVVRPSEKRYSSSAAKNYVFAFVRNFRKGTLVFLVLLIPAAFAAVNAVMVFYGLLEDSLFSYVLCGISIFLFLFIWSYAFPLTACFESGVFRTISNALVLSVAHLPTTIAVTVLNLVPVLILLFLTDFFFKWIMLWLFLGFALIAKANAWLLERVFRRYPAAEETSGT